MRSATRKSTIPAVGAVVLFIFFTKTASALVGLGVSPAEVVFSNLYVDGFGSQVVVVSSSSLTELGVLLSIEGSGAEWLTLEPPDVRVRKGKPASVRIIAEPEDAAPGEYVLFLVASAASGGGASEGAVSVIQPELRLPLILQITGKADERCSAAVSLGIAEENHNMPLSVAVSNLGNVRISPSATVDVLSAGDELLLSHTFALSPVRPGESLEHAEHIEHGLSEGSYFALVSVPACGYFATHELKVIEEKPLAVELESFSVPETSSRDEFIPLTLILRNPHERAVEVVGVVEIMGENGVSSTVRSERMLLAASEEQAVTLYHQPGEPGAYVMRAYAESLDSAGVPVSLGTQVIERTTSVSSPAGKIRLVLLIAGFAAAVIVLLFLIRREHKKRELTR